MDKKLIDYTEEDLKHLTNFELRKIIRNAFTQRFRTLEFCTRTQLKNLILEEKKKRLNGMEVRQILNKYYDKGIVKRSAGWSRLFKHTMDKSVGIITAFRGENTYKKIKH